MSLNRTASKFNDGQSLMSKSKLDIQSNMSRADMSSTNDNDSKISIQHRLKRMESKSPFEDSVGDLKNQFESKLTLMRDDIYRKEREIYDLKNQINLVNLRITKEGESKDNAELNLKKIHESYNNDATKVKQTVQSADKDNHILKTKLQDMLRQLNELNAIKTQTSGVLDLKLQEIEEDQRQFNFESEEQNQRIAVLHTEVKELQDVIINDNHRGSNLNHKIKELTENHSLVQGEQAEKMFKLKSEHERLKGEN